MVDDPLRVSPEVPRKRSQRCYAARLSQFAALQSSPEPRMTKAKVLGALLALLLLPACMMDDAAPEPGRVVYRDSMAISIVATAEPEWLHESPWQIETEPATSIGAVDGDDRYLFHDIVSAHRLSNGQVVVADRQSGELRYYTEDGAVARISGGIGEGPGLFGLLGYVAVIGRDTVVAMDADRPRLTFFDGDGNLLDVVDISTSDGTPTLPVSVSRTGEVLSFGIVPFDPVDEQHEKHLVRLFLHSSPTQPGQELLRIPWAEFWSTRSGSGGREPIPFAPRGLWASSLAGFVTGASDTSEILLWSGTGELQRIVRWGGELTPVGNTERDRYRADRVARSSSENARRAAQRALDELPWPDHMPAYQSLVVDDMGNLWIELYRPSWYHELRWTVIDSSGVWRGDVLLPSRFRPTHIGEEFLLGVWRNDDDVEFVHEYGLKRSTR